MWVFISVFPSIQHLMIRQATNYTNGIAALTSAQTERTYVESVSERVWSPYIVLPLLSSVSSCLVTSHSQTREVEHQTIHSVSQSQAVSQLVYGNRQSWVERWQGVESKGWFCCMKNRFVLHHQIKGLDMILSTRFILKIYEILRICYRPACHCHSHSFPLPHVVVF